MSKYNHGAEFVSDKPSVSFTSVTVIDSDSRMDSLDDPEKVSLSPSQPEQEANKKRSCCACIVATIAVVLFISLLSIGSRNYPNTHSAQLYKERTNRDRCEDSNYGCCEVYNLCQVQSEDNLTYIHRMVYPSRELKYDRVGSNCPRMIEMVRKYNSNYYPSQDSSFSCLDSEFGCCSIDVSCDQYVHFGIEINIGDNKETNYSLYEISDPTIRYLNIKKRNERGDNCPSFDRIVMYYNFDYPNINLTLIGIGLIALAFAFMGPCFNKLCEICNR